ncbi:RNA-directed DNA polymerase from mobile element jockey [Araneus ventricosus]|uniref:RNA-directed DNA polymerase from mobile element jockey n=1 Tax=Araneus ventricosus TaxID=182803 RepID=A0A4Y2JZ36_ARAVE|nr:RNA-directed DNA polymerase from mobile element jockey [Araneus ventricosus]
MTEAGVVQGSRLGPHCFNIFINDIWQMPDTELCLFVYDTAIMSSGPNADTTMSRLNTHLTELGRWLIKWKIKINSEKFQTVYFSRSRNQPFPPKLCRWVTPWCEDTKYLGITLDKKFTFKTHITSIKTKLQQAREQLKPLIGKKSKLSLDNRMFLYKSMLLPLISYACPVWLAAANKCILSLESPHNVAIRRIIRMPWFIRNENIRKYLDLPTIKEYYKKNAKKFYHKLYSSTNTAILSIPTYDLRSNRNRRRPRAALHR